METFYTPVLAGRFYLKAERFLTLTLRDVSERQRMQRAQTTYMAELEQTNRELDEFAHAASHDLKAPLRAVDNLASWIERDAAQSLPEKSRDHLARMRSRVQRMEGLLDDLLAFSKAGRTVGEESVIDMQDLVTEVTGNTREREIFGTCRIGRRFLHSAECKELA